MTTTSSETPAWDEATKVVEELVTAATDKPLLTAEQYAIKMVWEALQIALAGEPEGGDGTIAEADHCNARELVEALGRVMVEYPTTVFNYALKGPTGFFESGYDAGHVEGRRAAASSVKQLTDDAAIIQAALGDDSVWAVADVP